MMIASQLLVAIRDMSSRRRKLAKSSRPAARMLAPGYGRKVTHDIRWRIQLNVFNVGGRNKLVPIACGVDSDWASKVDMSTLGPDTVVPMVATGYSIKQGMSWQLTNTFEF